MKLNILHKQQYLNFANSELTTKTEVPCNLYINPAQITSVNARANYNLDGELVNYCTITLASGEMFFTLMTLDDISQAINNLTN